MILQYLPTELESEEWIRPILDEVGGAECWKLLATSLRGLHAGEEDRRSESEAATRQSCELCWKALHRADWRLVNGACPISCFAVFLTQGCKGPCGPSRIHGTQAGSVQLSLICTRGIYFLHLSERAMLSRWVEGSVH